MRGSRTTETIEEAADWFCDNPNCSDILDELRMIDSEAEARGRRWAIELLDAWIEESCDERGQLVYIQVREELFQALERVSAEAPEGG